MLASACKDSGVAVFSEAACRGGGLGPLQGRDRLAGLPFFPTRRSSDLGLEDFADALGGARRDAEAGLAGAVGDLAGLAAVEDAVVVAVQEDRPDIGRAHV